MNSEVDNKPVNLITRRKFLHDAAVGIGSFVGAYVLGTVLSNPPDHDSDTNQTPTGKIEVEPTPSETYIGIPMGIKIPPDNNGEGILSLALANKGKTIEFRFKVHELTSLINNKETKNIMLKVATGQYNPTTKRCDLAPNVPHGPYEKVPNIDPTGRETALQEASFWWMDNGNVLLEIIPGQNPRICLINDLNDYSDLARCDEITDKKAREFCKKDQRGYGNGRLD